MGHNPVDGDVLFAVLRKLGPIFTDQVVVGQMASVDEHRDA